MQLNIFLTNSGTVIKHDDLLLFLGNVKLEELLKKMRIVFNKQFFNKAIYNEMLYYKIIMSNSERYISFARYSGIINYIKKIKDSEDCLNVQRKRDTQNKYTNIKKTQNTSICIKNLISNGKKITTNCNIVCTHNQNVIFNYVISNYFNVNRNNNGNSTCLLIMDTGLGKTYMAGKFIDYLKLKTIVVLPSTASLDEWVKMLEGSFVGIKIGYYYSKKKIYNNCDVLITVNNSVGLPEWKFKDMDTVVNPQKLFKNFGFVIYDEVHNFTSTVKGDVFWKLNNSYVLGLTATPDENSKGFDEYYYKHIGKPLICKELKGYIDTEIKWNINVSVCCYFGPKTHTKPILNRDGVLNFGKMCDKLTEDPFRNSLVMAKIKKLYDKGDNVFIFANERKVLVTYLKYLQDYLNIPVESPELGVFMGGVDVSVKQNVSVNGRLILMTYSYGSESISIPHMNSLVLLTPRKAKLRQIIGRITRRNGNVELPRKIIDVVDYNTPLRKQFNVRNSIYTDKECKVKIKKYYWDKIDLLPIFAESGKLVTSSNS